MTRRRLRVIVGAVGLAGHALPALALARRLRERGHEVRFHTYERWRGRVEEAGLEFDGAEDEISSGLESIERPDVADRARAMAASIEGFGADVVVSDALTLSPALAAELAGVPRALLLPEVYPAWAPGMPPFSLGLRPPRTRLGAAGWRLATPLLAAALPRLRWRRASRAALGRERERLGLAPSADPDGFEPGSTVLVATLPQLEYPRSWPEDVHVIGPLSADEPGTGPAVAPGPEPLIVVAPSTVKDPDAELARTVIAATASESVRLAISTGGAPKPPAPANAVVADWLDYGPAMREASLVVCHGNHGAVTRALCEGAPLVVSPALPDDAEHGARVAWARAGVTVPRRRGGVHSMRAAIERVLGEPGFAARAREISAWASAHDPARRGAELVEGLAR